MKQVDKYFKEKLVDHESTVPSDMWERIAPALQEESNKVRPIFWLLSIAGILLVGGLLSLYLIKNDNNMTIPVGTAASTVPQDVINDYQETKLSDVESITNSDASMNSEVVSISSNKTINHNPNLLASRKIVKQPVDSKESQVSHSNSSIASGFGSTIFSSEANTSVSNIQKSDKEFKLVITKSYFDGNEKINDVNTTMTLHGETRRYLNSIKELELPYMANAQKAIEAKESFLGRKAPQCPSFINERVGFFADAYLSHDVPFKSQSGDNVYAKLRKDSENSLYSFGAGIRFSYFLKKGFGIRSGLNYTQINERFAYDDPDAQMTKTVKTITEVINSQGDTTLTETTEIVQVQGRHQITNRNKYHFIDVPILLFYEFGNGDSPFYYSINAGTYVNLLFSQTGKYLSTEENPISYLGDDEYPNPFKTSAGVSLYASFGVHYILNENIDLIFEPHIMTQLKSLTREGYPINQKFTTLGLNTGVRYKF